MRLSEIMPGMRLIAYVGDFGWGIKYHDVLVLDRVEKSLLDDDMRFIMHFDSSYVSGSVKLKTKDFLSIFNIIDDRPNHVNTYVSYSPDGCDIQLDEKAVLRLRSYCTTERRSGRYPWGKNLTGDLPKVKFIQMNGEYTTAVWQDGTHTVVKLADQDMYDEDKLYMILVMKKIFGNNNSAMRRYFKQFSDNVKEV